MQSNDDQQQKMFSLIDQWQQSKLSQKHFCEQNNIRYYVFHYWLGRYRKQNPEQTPAFTKLSVSPIVSHGYAELIMPNGKRLLFHQPVTSEFLKTLIA